MPTYTIEFDTPDGPARRQFTLDHDRSLGDQLPQVVEELRQRGVVLLGGAAEQLAVLWNGRTLELDRLLPEQGVSPLRPLVLRMQAPVGVATAAVLPVSRLTRGAVGATLQGGTAGWLAWLGQAAVVELPGAGLLAGMRYDLAMVALLGALTGLLVLGGAARREAGHALVAGALGAVVGCVAAGSGFVLAWMVAGGAPGPMVAATAAWLPAMALLGAALGVLAWREDPRRVVEGTVWGCLGGVCGAAAGLLPGPGEFWQCAAFVAAGALVAWGVAGAALQRAPVVLEFESSRGGWASLVGLRELAVFRGRTVSVGGARVEVPASGSRLVPEPAGGEAEVRVDGVPLRGPVPLSHGATITVGHLRFRALVRC